MKIGVWVLGLASIAAGILDLIWGEFEAAHQPIQALSDHIPGVTILAYLTATWLIVGGAGLLVERTARIGALMLAFIYTLFAIFWLPRFVTVWRYLGFHLNVYIGLLGGLGAPLIVTIGALLAYARVGARILSSGESMAARWLFGLLVVDFGAVHLIAVPNTAAMIPTWMPLGGAFWTVVSGVAFILAGLGIVSGVLDVLAARLLGLMFLLFGILVLTPNAIASPHRHIPWGGDAFNLAVAGATLIFSDWLSTRRADQAIQANHRVDPKS